MKKKRKQGRPSKISEELVNQFCECMELGLPIGTACDLVGITYATYYNYREKGEEEIEWMEENGEDSPRPENKLFYEFLKTTTRSRAKGVATAIRKIREAGEKDWKAEAWYLERCHSSDFGKKSEVDVTSGGEKLDGPVLYMPTMRDDDETE